MALHGGDAGEVRDVDVLLDRPDAERVRASLGLAARDMPPHPLFRSGLFTRWTEPPLTVEFMADFAVNDGTAWQAIALSTREERMIGGQRVHVPAIDELAATLIPSDHSEYSVPGHHRSKVQRMGQLNFSDHASRFRIDPEETVVLGQDQECVSGHRNVDPAQGTPHGARYMTKSSTSDRFSSEIT